MVLNERRIWNKEGLEVSEEGGKWRVEVKYVVNIGFNLFGRRVTIKGDVGRMIFKRK